MSIIAIGQPKNVIEYKDWYYSVQTKKGEIIFNTKKKQLAIDLVKENKNWELYRWGKYGFEYYPV